jgi:hypothetical protein
MPAEPLLTLHCPQCRQLSDVVTEGEALVCLVCGWKFDDEVAARFLTPGLATADALGGAPASTGESRGR